MMWASNADSASGMLIWACTVQMDDVSFPTLGSGKSSWTDAPAPAASQPKQQPPAPKQPSLPQPQPQVQQRPIPAMPAPPKPLHVPAAAAKAVPPVPLKSLAVPGAARISPPTLKPLPVPAKSGSTASGHSSTAGQQTFYSASTTSNSSSSVNGGMTTGNPYTGYSSAYSSYGTGRQIATLHMQDFPHHQDSIHASQHRQIIMISIHACSGHVSG